MKKKSLAYLRYLRLCPIFLTGVFLSFNVFTKAANWYVNDASLTGDVFTTAIGNNANSGTSSAPFLTIAQAVSVAANGDRIFVDVGNYEEDVLVNKSLTLTGAGIDKTFLWGVKATQNPLYAALYVTGNNIIIEGFTIGRNGNNIIEWKDGLNTAGVGLANASNVIIRNNKFKHNRTAIDVISSNGCTIHNNVIDFNRTGMFFHNQCQNDIIKENFIINSWVIGVLWVSSGTNDATGTKFYNNNISGSGYTHIENRNPNGGLKNFAYNWLGSCRPDTVSSVPRVEPDDSLIIPVVYGGSYVPPTESAIAVRGSNALALSQIIYTPFLKSPVDMNIDNGTGIIGFQGNFSTGSVNANAGPDVTIYKGYGPSCATLTAIGPPSYSYKWSNGACTQSITVCPNYTTKYTLTVSDNLGCLTKSCDYVTVKVIDVRCNRGKDDDRDDDDDDRDYNNCHKNDKDQEKVMMCNGCKVKCVKEKDVESYLCKGYKLGPCSFHKTTGSIEDLEILVTPNPFSGRFNLTYASNTDAEATVSVYDLTGKLVQSSELSGFYNEVYLGQILPPGIYSVVFMQGESRKTFRVIKGE